MGYKKKIFVIDTETGGLPSKLKKTPTFEIAITELAIYVLDLETLEIEDNMNVLFAPYKEGLIYTEEAARVSGIDRQYCEKHGLFMEEAFKKIKAFCYKNGGRSKKLVCGHNYHEFDKPFVDNLFKLNNDDSNKIFHDYVIDTMWMARLFMRELTRHKLSVCCEASNVILEDSHHAGADTKSTLLFLKYLIEKSETTPPQTQPTPLISNMKQGFAL